MHFISSLNYFFKVGQFFWPAHFFLATPEKNSSRKLEAHHSVGGRPLLKMVGRFGSNVSNVVVSFLALLVKLLWMAASPSSSFSKKSINDD